MTQNDADASLKYFELYMHSHVDLRYAAVIQYEDSYGIEYKFKNSEVRVFYTPASPLLSELDSILIDRVKDLRNLNDSNEFLSNPFMERVPLTGGISIGVYSPINSSGTLGALFTDGKYTYGITNCHVISNGEAIPYQSVFQPSRVDAGELELPETFHTIGQLIKMQLGNNLDVGVFKVADNAEIDGSRRNWKTLNGYSNPHLQEPVHKVGRTTGLTYGKVLSTNTVIRMDHLNRIGKYSKEKYIIFSNQIMTDVHTAGGDSGSILANEKNNAVGLTFAHNKTCNRSFHNKFSTVVEFLQSSHILYNGYGFSSINFNQFI